MVRTFLEIAGVVMGPGQGVGRELRVVSGRFGPLVTEPFLQFEERHRLLVVVPSA